MVHYSKASRGGLVFFSLNTKYVISVITIFFSTGVKVARQRRRLLAPSGLPAEFENPWTIVPSQSRIRFHVMVSQHRNICSHYGFTGTHPL